MVTLATGWATEKGTLSNSRSRKLWSAHWVSFASPTAKIVNVPRALSGELNVTLRTLLGSGSPEARSQKATITHWNVVSSSKSRVGSIAPPKPPDRPVNK